MELNVAIVSLHIASVIQYLSFFFAYLLNVSALTMALKFMYFSYHSRDTYCNITILSGIM